MRSLNFHPAKFSTGWRGEKRGRKRRGKRDEYRLIQILWRLVREKGRKRKARRGFQLFCWKKKKKRKRKSNTTGT